MRSHRDIAENTEEAEVSEYYKCDGKYIAM